MTFGYNFFPISFGLGTGVDQKKKKERWFGWLVWLVWVGLIFGVLIFASFSLLNLGFISSGQTLEAGKKKRFLFSGRGFIFSQGF